MKISVITAVYNAEKTIADTINSVIAGGHDNIEHIIIDGGSTDGTLELIKSLEHDKLKWISEKDSGIYDAMNKGIRLATGDYISTLNADDYYVDSIIGEVVKILEGYPETEIFHGDICYLKGNGSFIFPSHMKDAVKGTLRKCVHHPSSFVSRNVYDRLGMYDTSYRVSADSDFFCRCRTNDVKFKYLSLIHI